MQDNNPQIKFLQESPSMKIAIISDIHGYFAAFMDVANGFIGMVI
jgi:hypothetical protein